MLISLITSLGVPQRFAKAVLIAAGVVGLIVLLGVAKCSYDRSVIERHDAKLAPVVRAADAHAADARIVDTAKIKEDADAETRAIAPIPPENVAARRRARACAILQRQAAERGDAAPAGC